MLYAKFLLFLSIRVNKVARVSPEFLAKRLYSISVRLAYRAVSRSKHNICKCKGCSGS